MFNISIDKISFCNIRNSIVSGFPVVSPGTCWSGVGEVLITNIFVSRLLAREVKSWNVSYQTCLYAASITSLVNFINLRETELLVNVFIVHHVYVAINVHKSDGIQGAHSIFVNLVGDLIRLSEFFTSVHKLHVCVDFTLFHVGKAAVRWAVQNLIFNIHEASCSLFYAEIIVVCSSECTIDHHASICAVVVIESSTTLDLISLITPRSKFTKSSWSCCDINIIYSCFTACMIWDLVFWILAALWDCGCNTASLWSIAKGVHDWNSLWFNTVCITVINWISLCTRILSFTGTCS